MLLLSKPSGASHHLLFCALTSMMNDCSEMIRTHENAALTPEDSSEQGHISNLFPGSLGHMISFVLVSS
jgi:hypothetical protein